MRFRTILNTFFCLTIMVNIAHSNCLDLIRLAKTTSKTVMSEESARSSVNNFCEEYQSFRARGTGSNFGLEYKFLSINSGSSRSYTDQQFNRHCSDSQVNENFLQNYNQYLEAIDPNVWSSYKTCKSFKQRGISVHASRDNFYPTQGRINASYRSNNSHNTNLVFSHVGDQTAECSWVQAGSTLDGPVVSLSPNQSAHIECKRKRRDSAITISIYDEASPDKPVSIIWPAYNEDGHPVNVITSLNDQIDNLEAGNKILEQRIRGFEKHRFINSVTLTNDNKLAIKYFFHSHNKVNETDSTPSDPVKVGNLLQCPNGAAMSKITLSSHRDIGATCLKFDYGDSPHHSNITGNPSRDRGVGESMSCPEGHALREIILHGSNRLGGSCIKL